MKLAADSLSCEGRSGVDGTTAETIDCVCRFGDRGRGYFKLKKNDLTDVSQVYWKKVR